jgi:hypothetical protein
LGEIEEMVKIRADIKNIQLIFDFENGIENNKKDSLSKKIPREVIGDRDRFK